jgi:hypothetical protein
LIRVEPGQQRIDVHVGTLRRRREFRTKVHHQRFARCV